MRYVSSNTDFDEPASAAWCNASAGLISASFLILASVNVLAGKVAAIHGKVSHRSLFTIAVVLWTPLRLFVLAAAAACVAVFLFSLERGRTIGERRRRLLRDLAVLVAGVAIAACTAGT